LDINIEIIGFIKERRRVKAVQKARNIIGCGPYVRSGEKVAISAHI